MDLGTSPISWYIIETISRHWKERSFSSLMVSSTHGFKIRSSPSWLGLSHGADQVICDSEFKHTTRLQPSPIQLIPIIMGPKGDSVRLGRSDLAESSPVSEILSPPSTSPCWTPPSLCTVSWILMAVLSVIQDWLVCGVLFVIMIPDAPSLTQIQLGFVLSTMLNWWPLDWP